jgi:hypothetical protein
MRNKGLHYLLGAVLIFAALFGVVWAHARNVDQLRAEDPAAYERYQQCIQLGGLRCAEVASMPSSPAAAP